MTKLREIFEDVDQKYDELYEEYFTFNDNQNKDEKEKLLYKIQVFKEQLRHFERNIKDMYLPSRKE